MNSNNELPGNPYSSPLLQNATAGNGVRWRKWLAAILICVAVLLLLASLSNAFEALELVNQEYYQFWKPRSVSYGFELNGEPISADELIRWNVRALLTDWLIATGLVITARWLTKN